MQLQNLSVRKILNSRQEPTLELRTRINGKLVRASAPSGKSRGANEVEPWSVHGIDFSLNFLKSIGKQLLKIKFEQFADLEQIEQLVKSYDSSPRLELVGGNCLYLLEALVLKALAVAQGLQLWQFLLKGKAKLPRPLGNCIGGGLHAKQAKRTDFQEFLLLPKTRSFEEAVKANLKAYEEAKRLLSKQDKAWKGQLTDESAFAASLDNESVLELLEQVKDRLVEARLELGIDLAASTFYKQGYYLYRNFSKKEKEKRLTEQEQISYVAELAKRFKLSYVEDPLASESFEGFAHLLKAVPVSSCLVAGDDLTCTQLKLVKKAIAARAINALIIKPNQVGSLLESAEVVKIAKQAELALVISHRSGETEDELIADLAVGWQLPFIKCGILGKERQAKLNRLIEIEKQL